MPFFVNRFTLRRVYFNFVQQKENTNEIFVNILFIYAAACLRCHRRAAGR